MRFISNTRALALVAIVAACTLLSAGAVNAYNTFNGHKLTYGVNNQRYWLDSTALDSHPNAIPAAVEAWSATTDTRVYYTRTSTKSQSRLDFYRRSSPSNSYCATTRMYVDEELVDPNDRNWWWAKVIIDPALANASLCGASTHRKGILAHEHGHAMGLAHTSNPATLMYVGIAGTSVSKPAKDDRNGINALY